MKGYSSFFTDSVRHPYVTRRFRPLSHWKQRTVLNEVGEAYPPSSVCKRWCDRIPLKEKIWRKRKKMISLKQMNQKGVLEAKRTKVWSRRSRPKRYGSPRHPYRVRETKLNCFREGFGKRGPLLCCCYSSYRAALVAFLAGKRVFCASKNHSLDRNGKYSSRY